MILKLSSALGYLIKDPGRTFKILKHGVEMSQCCNRVAPFYSPKYPRVLARGIRLFLRGYRGEEALTLGLLDVGIPDSELCKFVSKSEMTKIEEALNPQAWREVTENKAIFYKFCNSLGIPVPELYAIWFKRHAGYSRDGVILKNRADWENFFRLWLPEEFVIKPAIGAYGWGVKVFRRSGQERFIDVAADKTCKANDILDIMLSFSQHDSFVIQERLKSHPEIVRLSGSENLQTLRIWTYLDGNGQCRIIHAFFKPIVGKNVVDNHEHGLKGNLLAEVALDTGTLKPAVKMIPNVSGLATLFIHPDTGQPLEGFAIPLWDEACRLAEQTALKFMPLRLIGWDIAVTSDGLRIIEGNCYGDPPSFDRNMDIMLAPVREDLLSTDSGGTTSKR